MGSLAVSRHVSSLRFEVSSTDPLIYMAGVLIMMLVAIVASALPARDASADRVVSLRAA